MTDSPVTTTTSTRRGSNEDKDRVGTACVACRRNHQSCQSVKPCQRCVSKGIECVMPEVKTRGVKSRKRTHDFANLLSIPQMYDITNPAEMDASLNLGYDLLDEDLDLNFNYINGPSISPELGSSISGEFGSSLGTPFSSSPEHHESSYVTHTPSQPVFLDNCPPSLQLIPQSTSCQARMQKLGIRDSPAHQQAWEKYLNKVNMLRNWVTPEQKDTLSRNFEIQKDALVRGTDELSYPAVLWGRCGVLLHVNKPFRELTGFSQQVPVEDEGSNIMDMFSPDTLARKYESFAKIFSGLANTYTDTQAKLRTFAKSKDAEFEFTDVIMAISVKRDVFELPHLFHAVFVPVQTGLGEPSHF